MDKISVFEWLTLTAIIVGPLLAVFATRCIDKLRGIAARRMEVFRTLMRTRRIPVSAEHVGALNLVEIEFQSDPTVIKCWKSLLEHFATQHNRGDTEVIDEIEDSGEIRLRNERFNTRLMEERAKLLARLLHEMGRILKFRAEQLDIFDGGYTPQAWVTIDDEQTFIRRYFIDIALGRRSLPITVLDYTPAEVVDTLEKSAVKTLDKNQKSNNQVAK